LLASRAGWTAAHPAVYASRARRHAIWRPRDLVPLCDLPDDAMWWALPACKKAVARSREASPPSRPSPGMAKRMSIAVTTHAVCLWRTRTRVAAVEARPRATQESG